MICNLNDFYRCTRKRIARCKLTPGMYFSYAPIRKYAPIMHFVRRVMSVDYQNGFVIDHFGHKTLFTGPDVYICSPR